MKVITKLYQNDAEFSTVERDISFGVVTKIEGAAVFVTLLNSNIPKHGSTQYCYRNVIKVGDLVMYERHYNHGDMGWGDIIKPVDVNQLERCYFLNRYGDLQV